MIREKKNVKSIIYLSGSIIGIVLLTFLLALTSNTDNNVNESKINQNSRQLNCRSRGK